ncbi:hypothetical protein KUCAC02_033738 [Chaenocephalus aceratus]|nr:hypothetical protein KUCAC02_033738 [Chaenocephalus aceratus]
MERSKKGWRGHRRDGEVKEGMERSKKGWRGQRRDGEVREGMERSKKGWRGQRRDGEVKEGMERSEKGWRGQRRDGEVNVMENAIQTGTMESLRVKRTLGGYEGMIDGYQWLKDCRTTHVETCWRRTAWLTEHSVVWQKDREHVEELIE